MDQLAAFAAGLPAWLGPDGFPRSWQHFSYGMRHLNRGTARSILDIGAGVRGGMATEKSYTKWRNEIGQKA